jgi:hypothetical protein
VAGTAELEDLLSSGWAWPRRMSRRRELSCGTGIAFQENSYLACRVFARKALLEFAAFIKSAIETNQSQAESANQQADEDAQRQICSWNQSKLHASVWFASTSDRKGGFHICSDS